MTGTLERCRDDGECLMDTILLTTVGDSWKSPVS